MGILSKTKWDDFLSAYNDTKSFPTLTEVAGKLSINVDTVRHTAIAIRRDGLMKIVDRHGKANSKIEAGAEFRTIETVPDDYHEPIEDVLERAMRHNERYAAHHDQKSCIDIAINIEGPFGVVGLPDNHLNNIGTLLRRAFKDAQTIADHPALFAVGIGDWLDNFIVGRLERERRKDVVSHPDSWRMLEHYFEIIAPKLIAAISGNHMDWTTDMGGVDVMKKLLSDKGLAPIYDTDEIRVRLKSPNGVSFTHLARHKFPGHSKYNSMHGILVWMLERWQGEDVFWGGHIHTSAHAEIEKAWLGRPSVVHGIQLAAYKDIDGYATREGFRRNVPFMTPMTVHDPVAGSTTFFADMNEGIRYLDMLRKDFASIAA